MIKKLLIIFSSILFLTACGKKDVKYEPVVPEGFQGPTSGPPADMAPPFPPAEEPLGAFDLK